MLMPLRVQWLVQPSVYTRRPCHIRSTHNACVYRQELEDKQTSQWFDHSPCRCVSPSPFAAVRREIEHQSLARQHRLAHGVPAVLPQSFSRGRQFLPRRRSIADTPASPYPAPCPMPKAPRIPADSERITGLPKGHSSSWARVVPLTSGLCHVSCMKTPCCTSIVGQVLANLLRKRSRGETRKPAAGAARLLGRRSEDLWIDSADHRDERDRA